MQETFYMRRCEMIRAKNLTIPKMDEVRSEVLQTIISRLGITKAAFFIRESMSTKVNYLEIKEELFGKKTAKDIYREIKSK